MIRAPIGSLRKAAVSLAALIPFLSACIALTALPRAVIIDADRNIAVRSVPCSAGAAVLALAVDSRQALDPRAIRLLTWNIHKQGDPGWQRDLARFVGGNDLLLLQEATLSGGLQAILEDGGLRWVMASSFQYANIDNGVLTATRTMPLRTCTERAVEPLLRIPKSAVVSWFALAGSTETLAVVNVHAINFSLSLEAYQAQFAALVAALASHDGPIVFAGDFNTWTDARLATVREAAATLKLAEIPFAEDRRSVFLGHQLDHILVRGLDVVDVEAIPVESSDHNPVRATFRLRERMR